jgi:methionyl-tRNA formyltransferase
MNVIFVGTAPLGRSHAAGARAQAQNSRSVHPAGSARRTRPGAVASPHQTDRFRAGLARLSARKINREAELIKTLNPDVIVVIAFGQFLSKKLLEIPKYGCINLHASLLPKYRGAAPIQWAIINGERETGLTTFLMNEEMDAGDILLQERVPISDEDTAGSLHDKLAALGPDLVLRTLEGLERGTLTPRPQDHSQATFAPKIESAMGQIDWAQPARKIFNLIRGLNPSPGAYTFWEGQRLKLYASRVVPSAASAEPGEILSISAAGPIIQCGQDALELTEVQPAGKRRMSGRDFVNGYKVQVGARLG